MLGNTHRAAAEERNLIPVKAVGTRLGVAGFHDKAGGLPVEPDVGRETAAGAFGIVDSQLRSVRFPVNIYQFLFAGVVGHPLSRRNREGRFKFDLIRFGKALSENHLRPDAAVQLVVHVLHTGAIQQVRNLPGLFGRRNLQRVVHTVPSAGRRRHSVAFRILHHGGIQIVFFFTQHVFNLPNILTGRSGRFKRIDKIAVQIAFLQHKDKGGVAVTQKVGSRLLARFGVSQRNRRLIFRQEKIFRRHQRFVHAGRLPVERKPAAAVSVIIFNHKAVKPTGLHLIPAGRVGRPVRPGITDNLLAVDQDLDPVVGTGRKYVGAACRSLNPPGPADRIMLGRNTGHGRTAPFKMDLLRYPAGHIGLKPGAAVILGPKAGLHRFLSRYGNPHSKQKQGNNPQRKNTAQYILF